MTSYACGICGTKRDQRSHHKLHLDSEKHKQSKELFRHQLKDMDADDRHKNYFTDDIGVIIGHIETQEYNKDGDLINDLRMYAIHNITNKDALRDKIHDIHNFLRNNGIGYGMNALKAFNVLYGLMRIEESGLFDKVDLPMECRFSYLVDLSKKNKHEQVTGLILQKVLDSIIRHKKMKHFLFYELPKNVRADVYSQLVLQIHELRLIEKSCGVQLSGKIYEYFIGRDDTAISEMGAYFTDRHIVEFINEEEPPHVDENGHVSTMIDPFGGSGGFTNGYIQHLVSQHPDIKWENELKNIYHYDMNEDVNKSAALEMFCLTGEIPIMNENVSCCNSFTSEFCNLNFKQVRTNPPYGGDKSKQTDAQQKRDKMMTYIKGLLGKPEGVSSDKLNVWKLQLKQLEQEKKKDKARSDKQKVSLSNSSIRIKKFAKKYGLKGNDKEAVSLILLMDILDEDGTAVGVLKEGVFFNKSYKDVRECVIKNFNVRKVISVPSDQFENTTTKTSIIVFDNTEQKTTRVEFSELVVEKYEEDVFVEGDDGSILLVENKGDFKDVSKNIVAVVDVDRLKENDWSLNGKDYTKKHIQVGIDFEPTLISSVCKVENGYAFKSTEYKTKGIPLLTIKHIPNFHLINECKYIQQNDAFRKFLIEKNDILISLTGNAESVGLCGMYLNDYNAYCNQRVGRIRITDPVLNMYVFFMLHLCKEYISGNGSIQHNISTKTIEDLSIPVPKSPEKIKMWVDKISKPYNEMHEKKKQLKQLQEQVQTRVKEIIENEPCDEFELKSLCSSITTGKHLDPKDRNGSKYPYYGATKIMAYTDKDDDKMMFKGNHLLVARKGTLCINIIINGNFYANDDVIVVSPVSNTYFIYNVMIIISDKISKLYNGSIVKGIKQTDVSSIKIPIPKDNSLLTDLNSSFQQIVRLEQEISSSQGLYTQYIKELGEEAIISSH